VNYSYTNCYVVKFEAAAEVVGDAPPSDLPENLAEGACEEDMEEEDMDDDPVLPDDEVEALSFQTNKRFIVS
jgi:hypothetical protein